MTTRLVLIRHSGLRNVSSSEVLSALETPLRELPRGDHDIQTAKFSDDVESGRWEGQDAFLRSEARKILEDADSSDEPSLHYFGLAEVPHVIALGAHLGDERYINLHDFNRDTNSWRWATEDLTVSAVSDNVPSDPAITARGIAVLRVAITYPISDTAVDEVVTDDRLADITVHLRETADRLPGRVRSAADVEHIRLEVRRVLAALRNARPNLESIHLFVAAPVSVCFAIGQELKPRNSVPIQTYRFRDVPGRPANTPAILLTAGELEAAPDDVTEADAEIAKKVREEIWSAALEEVTTYAEVKRQREAEIRPWYKNLQPADAIAAAAPFPELRPIATIVPADDKVDPRPFDGDYGYDKDERVWRLSDRLLSSLHAAVQGDEEELRLLVHLFLFHEYLHDYHSLTKYTADEVGKFANCLEHIDYTADVYALLHQLDWASIYDRRKVTDPAATKEFLASQIDLVIRSFWAFEPKGANNEWQVRRLRRYLNWYWRQIQVLRAPDLATALLIFRNPPKVEIAGLDQLARGRRVLARLDRRDPTTHLEMGIVLEDERLLRIQEGPSTSLVALLAAFRDGLHEDIKAFFRAAFEIADQTGGALPRK